MILTSNKVNHNPYVDLGHFYVLNYGISVACMVISVYKQRQRSFLNIWPSSQLLFCARKHFNYSISLYVFVVNNAASIDAWMAQLEDAFSVLYQHSQQGYFSVRLRQGNILVETQTNQHKKRSTKTHKFQCGLRLQLVVGSYITLWSIAGHCAAATYRSCMRS